MQSLGWNKRIGRHHRHTQHQQSYKSVHLFASTTLYVKHEVTFDALEPPRPYPAPLWPCLSRPSLRSSCSRKPPSNSFVPSQTCIDCPFPRKLAAHEAPHWSTAFSATPSCNCTQSGCITGCLSLPVLASPCLLRPSTSSFHLISSLLFVFF